MEKKKTNASQNLKTKHDNEYSAYFIFDACPEIPINIAHAAESGNLVIFVGAGISRLAGYPLWGEFADKILASVTPTSIDYFVNSQLLSLKDPKKKLSLAEIIAGGKSKIDYASALSPSKDCLIEKNVYDYLNRFKCAFVTTNYDKNLIPESQKNKTEEEWRFFRCQDFLSSKLDIEGSVIHLHGCLVEPETMIVTMKDYLERYQDKNFKVLLEYLFKQKTVLFLGYGLDEMEILEFILRTGRPTTDKSKEIKRFILQGFFNAEFALFELLKKYYLETFNTELIGFPRDRNNYNQIEEILSVWSKDLEFIELQLADEAALLLEEING